MEQAKILMAEIERKKEAMNKTKSWKLKKDYQKSIYRDKRELKHYCEAKKIPMNQLHFL